jgi:hypothetical protein
MKAHALVSSTMHALNVRFSLSYVKTSQMFFIPALQKYRSLLLERAVLQPLTLHARNFP